MRHFFAICLLAAVFLFQMPATAQEVQKNTAALQNTSWKSYLGDPMNDTMIIRFATDSSFFGSRTGEPLVTTAITITGDTIVVTDVSGQYACLGYSGKYKYAITADELRFELIEDGCDGRASTITTSAWRRVK